MENASKALLMAAGVLMGVLILSLAVFLFSTFNDTADKIYHQMREEEVAQFNSFYYTYEGKTNLTYYDIWNVINKAKDDCAKYDGHVIDVFYGRVNPTTNLDILNKDFSIKSLKVVLGEADQEAKGTGSTGNPNFGRISESVVDSEGNTVFKLKEYTCKEIILDQYSGMVKEIKFVDT